MNLGDLGAGKFCVWPGEENMYRYIHADVQSSRIYSIVQHGSDSFRISWQCFKFFLTYTTVKGKNGLYDSMKSYENTSGVLIKNLSKIK